jgi:hypothetical protein
MKKITAEMVEELLMGKFVEVTKKDKTNAPSLVGRGVFEKALDFGGCIEFRLSGPCRGFFIPKKLADDSIIGKLSEHSPWSITISIIEKPVDG